MPVTEEPQGSGRRLHLENFGSMALHLKANWSDQHPPLAEVIKILHRQQIEAYLVGGAVRDLLLERPNIVDLDFVVADDGLAVARQVADALGSAYFPLDPERGVGRVIWRPLAGADPKKSHLDFATLRGVSLPEDLQDRDFTINAMALNLTDPPQLIDPLGGQADLSRQQLKVAAPGAFRRDPVRVLRAVRQAIEFGFAIEPGSQAELRQAASGITNTSAERQRDELLKLLNTPNPGQAVQLLHRLGVLAHFLPEVGAMVGVEQGPPHYLDVFEHTAMALEAWAAMLKEGLPTIPPEFQPAVKAYLAEHITGDLSLQQLIPVALLWHDTGKPLSRIESEGPDRKIRFLGHERVSSKLASRAMKALNFSNQATAFVETVVAHHLRPLLLTQDGGKISRRAIYRFFRDTTGPGYSAGIAVALHSLADQQATYPPASTPGQAQQQALGQVLHQLLTAYFEERKELVDPPPLLTGRDLIEQLGLKEGQTIGLLLNRLKEAQAMGLVTDKAAALAFIKNDPDFTKAAKQN
jgi:poly(A) polymerase